LDPKVSLDGSASRGRTNENVMASDIAQSIFAVRMEGFQTTRER
jgi:hypothetical protein